MRLSIIDYMEYLEGTNTSRCLYEGEEVLNSAHLILCGKLDFSSQVNNMFVCGLCLQTSDLKSHPHEIKGELEIINEKLKVKHMNFSCKAGKSGKCKHISALIIKCTRVDLETFEIISQTDLKCTWSKQKSMTEEKYQAVSIHKMPCSKDMTDDKEMQLVVDENKMYDFFVQKPSPSALGKHRLGRRQVTDKFTLLANDFKVHDHYIQNILNNAVQSPLMMELHSLEVHFPSNCCEQLYVELFGNNEESLILSMQQSKSWHDQRKFRVTVSRVYGLYTYSGKDWEKKSIQYFYPKKFTNKFIKHGIKYEAEARDVFKEKSGFMVFECGLLISHFNPRLGYSPDGLIMEEDKPVALLEIKCLYNGISATIKEAIPKATFLKKNNGSYELKQRHQYYGQIQLGMALSNVTKCYFVVYASFDKTLEIFEIDFDHEFSNEMLSIVKHNFFKKIMLTLCNNK